jgi:hypothetical protein
MTMLVSVAYMSIFVHSDGTGDLVQPEITVQLSSDIAKTVYGNYATWQNNPVINNFFNEKIPATATYNGINAATGQPIGNHTQGSVAWSYTLTKTSSGDFSASLGTGVVTIGGSAGFSTSTTLTYTVSVDWNTTVDTTGSLRYQVNVSVYGTTLNFSVPVAKGFLKLSFLEPYPLSSGDEYFNPAPTSETSGNGNDSCTLYVDKDKYTQHGLCQAVASDERLITWLDKLDNGDNVSSFIDNISVSEADTVIACDPYEAFYRFSIEWNFGNS